MKIGLIWVGKTKDLFIREGVEKYLKLLARYADMKVTEIRPEKGGDAEKVVEKESERIARLGVPYVLLDEKGKGLTSLEFAQFIQSRKPALNFVIGGAFGVSEKIRRDAADSISLSKMTFTHEMARLVLAEQIFRAFTIMNKRGYHH